MSIGKPEINEADNPMETWPLFAYNYWIDSQVFMEKLEEVLVVIKRENAYFVRENMELKEKLDELRQTKLSVKESLNRAIDKAGGQGA